jgi:hypothetical protein
MKVTKRFEEKKRMVRLASKAEKPGLEKEIQRLVSIWNKKRGKDAQK